MISGPADNHLVGVGIADFTGRDETAVLSLAPPSATGGKSPNTPCCLRNVDIPATGTLGRSALGRLIAPEHPSIVEEAVWMRTTQGDVMRLARRAGYSIEVKVVAFVRNQGRRDIRIIVRQSRTIGHETLSSSRWRVRGRGLS